MIKKYTICNKLPDEGTIGVVNVPKQNDMEMSGCLNSTCINRVLNITNNFFFLIRSNVKAS